MPRGTKRKTSGHSERPTKSSKASAQKVPLSKIEELPTDLLVKILHYVPLAQWPSMEGLSRTFRDTIYEAWKTVHKIRMFDDFLSSPKYFAEKDYNFPPLPEHILEKLALRATNLRDIGGFPMIFAQYQGDGDDIEFTFKCLDSNLATLSELRRIEAGRYADVRNLHSFIADCACRKQLTDLILVECIANEDVVHQQLADAFGNSEGKDPLRLEWLNLEFNNDNLVCWRNGSLSFKFLQTIDVSRLTTFLVLDTFVPRSKLAKFLQRATNMKRLSFSFSCGTTDKKSKKLIKHKCTKRAIKVILDENVAILESIGKLENLESLTIGSYRSDRDCACRDLSTSISELFERLGARRRANGDAVFEELGFVDPHVATPEFVGSIADHLPGLQSLKLTIDDVDMKTMKRVLRSQTALNTLQLTNNGNGQKRDDNDHEFVDWSDFGEDIGHRLFGSFDIEDVLPNATTLECLRIDFSEGGIIDGDLKDFGQLTRLKEFELRINHQVYEDVYEAFNEGIDEHVFDAWADGFGENLKSFTLGRSLDENIEEETLIEFFERTPALESLRLEEFSITDRFLQRLSYSCPGMKDLALCQCYVFDADGIVQEVGKAGLQEVVDRCTRLKTLSYTGYGSDDWFPHDLKMEKYRKIAFYFDL